MDGIYILLGTNLGDREKNLTEARSNITSEKINIIGTSPIYQSAAWGKEDQQDFLNQVLKLETHLSPEELLETALKVEQRMGRIRKEKWAERLIDIDLLFYHNEIINKENLTIPHPHIQDRRFTLLPLNDLASTEVHPKLNRTIHQILKDCTDKLSAKVFEGSD